MTKLREVFDQHSVYGRPAIFYVPVIPAEDMLKALDSSAKSGLSIFDAKAEAERYETMLAKATDTQEQQKLFDREVTSEYTDLSDEQKEAFQLRREALLTDEFSSRLRALEIAADDVLEEYRKPEVKAQFIRLLESRKQFEQLEAEKAMETEVSAHLSSAARQASAEGQTAAAAERNARDILARVQESLANRSKPPQVG